MDQQNQDAFQCNFCGKNRDQVRMLIAGPGVYICNHCVTLAHDIVSVGDHDPASRAEKNSDILDAQILKRRLDEFVVGQDDVKEVLCTSAVNHIKRTHLNRTENKELQKSNVLILGPTGTGKTLLAKTLAKILDIPIAIADATSLTESGYTGDDVDSILERLLVSAQNDLEAAQHGIIFVDEIDKKATRRGSNDDQRHANRDVSGEGVQQSLLKLVEGGIIKVKTTHKRGYEETVDFCTDDVLFIFSGSFVGLEKIIQRRLNRGASMGFTAQIADKTMSERMHLQKFVESKDLVDFGIIPELLGRIPVVGVMDQLSVDDYVHILNGIGNNMVGQYNEIANLNNISMKFTDDFLRQVSVHAHGLGLGARSLRTIMDTAVLKVFYCIQELQDSGVSVVRFTKYSEPPILVDTDGGEKPMTNYTLYRGTDVISTKP